MINQQRNVEEKRDFIRMKVECQAIIQTDEGSLEATCIDLSSSGMQLRTDAPLEVGQDIQVEITSKHSQLSSLKASGTVVWVENTDDGKQHMLGITITHMD